MIATCWWTLEYNGDERDSPHVAHLPTVRQCLQHRHSTAVSEWTARVQSGSVSPPSSNWVAMYVDNGYGEYFDSIRRAPPDVIRSYLNWWCGANRWIFNDRQLQSVISRLCGHYCIYFCALRSNGITMHEIVSLLSKDTALNDVLVHAFVIVVKY